MKILMLGWEYPPHISGGLGTACEGLTRGLARHGVTIDFVVPHLYGGENAPHMRLLDPSRTAGPGPVESPKHRTVTEVVTEIQHGEPVVETRVVSDTVVQETLGAARIAAAPGTAAGKDSSIRFIRVPSFLSPYLRPGTPIRRKRKVRAGQAGEAEDDAITADEFVEVSGEEILTTYFETVHEILPPFIRSLMPKELGVDSSATHYQGDLFSEVGRYTARVLSLVKDAHQYDAIHAHDWMTFPAAVALKAMTGLPLVLHVHSLEYDRAGDGGNWQIEQIERLGFDAADTLIAVSYYTRSLINRRHGTSLDKIEVVHNGVYAREVVSSYRKEGRWPGKIVLFLGRVTFQKGPDYFVEAAARVIPHVPDVLFVMAGSGDMLPRMMERVNELGIGNNFLFTGFLKGADVEKMYSMADLYVMPSVSEPFGISALEAISFNSPVIISRQSGVSEVLSHALKVNFWDVDQLANLVVSVLKYPELGQDISLMAGEEVRRLRWDAAAAKTVEIYGKTLARLAV